MRRSDGKIELLALLMNGAEKSIDFTLPAELRWRLVLDSAAPERGDTLLARPRYKVEAHACVILGAVFEAAP
jgi:glycogen operon protein